VAIAITAGMSGALSSGLGTVAVGHDLRERQQREKSFQAVHDVLAQPTRPARRPGRQDDLVKRVIGA
jgi:hypothetical protein